jgi:putative tricarboxylic transport membrane protein
MRSTKDVPALGPRDRQRRALLERAAALGALGPAALIPAATRAAAGWLPSKQITYVISVAPGGSVDLYARAIKQLLESKQLVNGQTVLAENRPGAAGLLTFQIMQRNAGDAHFLSTFHTGGIAGSVSGALKADIRELTPVAMMVEESTFAVVNAASDIHTPKDLLERFRRDPAALRIAVAPAIGQNTHLAIAKPLKAAGIDVRKLTVAPFRSSGDSMTALVGGHVDVVSATGPAILPHLASGRVRPVVTVARERAGAPFDKVPTWRESGVAADYVSYNGVQLPRGVTVDQIRFWEQALRRVSESTEWRDLVTKSGNKPVFLGYVDSRRYVEDEYKATETLFAELGLAGVGK